jgi:hypothetical protein
MGGENEGHELGYTGMPFSQCMSIPCELSLVKTGGEFRVLRYPIAETASLRKPGAAAAEAVFDGEYIIPAEPQNELEVSLTGLHGEAAVTAGRHTIRFDPVKKTLTFENGASVKMESPDLSFRMLADTTTMEVFFGRGVAATYATHPSGISLRVSGKGTVSVKTYALKSVWEAQ